MVNSMNNFFTFGIIGAILGGTIALFGYWVLSPQIDSLFLFTLLRAGIGAGVAVIVGPVIMRIAGKKNL